MRLEGFDEHPVTQPLIYTFVGDEDEVLLTSDRNVQSDAFTGWLPAPWDVTDIVVEQTDDVLGVFDEETAGNADGRHGGHRAPRSRHVDALVPEWSGRAVVYTISDLDALDRMSLMEVDQTGGVAFPVPVRPGRRKLAAYRTILNPVSTLAPFDRLVLLRHELTHVALGEADDHSPAVARGGGSHVRRRVEPAGRRPQAPAGARAG